MSVGDSLIAAGAALRAGGLALALLRSIAEGRAGDAVAIGVLVDSRISWVREAIALQNRCAH